MESGEGMSLSEFCYPLLQAWDWWEMYKSTGVQIQIGGADQFGNILTGAEGVKHVLRTHPHQDLRVNEDSEHWEPMGMTTPLLTSASGEKFGKSAGNAIWLDRELTGPFELYAVRLPPSFPLSPLTPAQYLLATPDAEIERHLKLFTFLPLPAIADLMAAQRAEPEQRPAQHALAREFLHLAHGSAAAREAADLHRARAAERRTVSIAGLLRQRADEVAAAVSKGGAPEYARAPPAGRLLTGAEKVPETVAVTHGFLLENSFPAVLQRVGLVASRSEGHRLITNRGAYVACDTASDTLDADHLTWRPITSPVKGAPAGHVKWEGENGLLVLRSGKWNVRIVKVFSDPEATEEAAG
jgi:tyrosyl-tRNA synthetase